MPDTTDPRIDPGWYWDPDRAEQEWRGVWARTWHIGPRVEEVAEPGDTYVHGFGRERLLFVHGLDGTVRGFFNVCRHRASPLVPTEDGVLWLQEFQCPFHGWRYSLDGSLTSVPYRDRFPADTMGDPERTALRQFRVDSFAGWLWFNLDDSGPGLAEYLGPLAPRLAAYRMERAHIIDYKTLEFACNWKTVLDAFNESYHFQTLHSDILSWGNEDAPITLLNIHSMMVNEYCTPSKLYPDRETVNPDLQAMLAQSGIEPGTFTGSALDVRGAIQRAKRAKVHDTIYPYATLTDSQLTDAYHYLAFPAVHFNLFPEFYVAMRYRPHPSGEPERMYFDFIMCAPLPAGEEVLPYEHRVVEASTRAVSDVLNWGAWQHPVVEQVLQEDVGLVEQVQRGLRSQSFESALLGQDERRLAHFHETISLLIEGASVRDVINARRTEPDAHAGS